MQTKELIEKLNKIGMRMDLGETQTARLQLNLLISEIENTQR